MSSLLVAIEHIRALKQEILDEKRKTYALKFMKNCDVDNFNSEIELRNIREYEKAYYLASEVIDEVLSLMETGKIK